MQAIELFNTARWIDSLYSDTTKDSLFSGAITGHLSAHVREKDSSHLPRTTAMLAAALDNVATARSALNEHPHASEVLAAFDLDALQSEDWPPSMYLHLLTESEKEKGIRKLYEEINTLAAAWRFLYRTVKCVEQLTTPKEIAEQSDFDDLLILQRRIGSSEVVT